MRIRRNFLCVASRKGIFRTCKHVKRKNEDRCRNSATGRTDLSYQRIRGTSHREIADAANVGPSNIRTIFPARRDCSVPSYSPSSGRPRFRMKAGKYRSVFLCRVTASYILLIVQMRDVSRTHHRTFESPPSGTAGAIRHFAARHRTQDVQASGAFQQSKRSGAAIAAPLRCRIVRMTAPRVFSNSTPHRRPVSWPDYPRSHRFSTPRRRRSYRIRGNRRDSPENRGNRRSSVPWQPCCRRPPPR